MLNNNYKHCTRLKSHCSLMYSYFTVSKAGGTKFSEFKLKI